MAGIFWLASYPKSGNTWVRIFLDNLMRRGGTPSDINALHNESIASSRAWLDNLLGFATADLRLEELERVRPACYAWAHEEATATQFHKIHDANLQGAASGRLVPGGAGCGVLYIVRNPLDVAPSAANHWNVPVDEAIGRMSDPDFSLARRGRQPLQVRQRLLDWSGHVRSWIDEPELPLRVVRYEDLSADPMTHFREIAAFLELPCDDDGLRAAIGHSSFSELARQEETNGFRERLAGTPRFFRSGRAGAWRESLDAGQVERIVDAHADVMRRFGYLDSAGRPA